MADKRIVLAASVALDKKDSRIFQFKKRSSSRQRKLMMYKQRKSRQKLVLTLGLLSTLLMQIPQPRSVWTIDRYSLACNV